MGNENFYNNYLNNSYSLKLVNQDEEKQTYNYFVKNFKKNLPKYKDAAILDIGIGDGQTLKTLKVRLLA